MGSSGSDVLRLFRVRDATSVSHAGSTRAAAHVSEERTADGVLGGLGLSRQTDIAGGTSDGTPRWTREGRYILLVGSEGTTLTRSTSDLGNGTGLL